MLLHAPGDSLRYLHPAALFHRRMIMQRMATPSSCGSSEADPKERRRQQNRRNQQRFRERMRQQRSARTTSGNDQIKSSNPQPGSSPARTMVETTTDAEREAEFPPELERQHSLPSFDSLEETEPSLPWAENEGMTTMYHWLDGVPAVNTDIARFNEHGVSTSLPDLFGNPMAIPQIPATPLSFPQHQPQAVGQLPAVPTFQPQPSPSLMGLGSYGGPSFAPLPLMASYKFEESVSYHTANGGQHTISVVKSFEAPASCAQSSEENHNQS